MVQTSVCDEVFYTKPYSKNFGLGNAVERDVALSQIFQNTGFA